MCNANFKSVFKLSKNVLASKNDVTSATKLILEK